MSPRAVTMGSVIAIGLGVAAWDVFLLLDEDPDNTISSVLGDHAWAAGILGYICGHLFSKSRTNLPRWGSASGGAISVGAAQAVGDPLLGFVLAFCAGLIFWPNRGVKKGGPVG